MDIRSQFVRIIGEKIKHLFEKGEAEQLKRELTRARSKLEEEKSIRGNIQVLPFVSFISLMHAGIWEIGVL